jgi:MFS family permease
LEGRRTRAPLYAVLGANAVSQIGDLTVAVAMPWFVLKTTGSVVQMGVAGGVVALGALLASVAGGPLIDRFGLRRASIVSDVTAGAAVAAIPLLYWSDRLPFGVFLALAFLISVLNAPGDLARRSLVPTLARWAVMPLERANSIDTSIPRLAQLVGPVVGGVLIVLVGAANVLLLNAATFALSAAAVLVGVPSRADHHAAGGDAAAAGHEPAFVDCRMTKSPAQQYWEELRVGFRFVRSSGLLLSLLAIVTVANLLEKPLMSVVAPVYAEEYYGSAASFGSMLGAFGAGALLGAIGFAMVAGRLPRRGTFVVCLLLAPAVMFTALALTPPLPLLLVAMVISGVIFGPMNAVSATVVQEATPPQLLGRVFGTLTSISMVGIPVGTTVVGMLISDLGLIPTMLCMTAVYLALGIVMALNPALKAMQPRTDLPVDVIRGG